MLANGFSEVSEFLYSKGSYLCLPVGLAQMLNKGAYHPLGVNPYGTKSWYSDTNLINTRPWHSSDIIYEPTTANSFLYATNGLHPSGYGAGSVESGASGTYDGTGQIRDSKYYDIIYSDQFKDLREYAKIANKYEIELLREDKRVNSCVDEVSTDYCIQTYSTLSNQTPVLVAEDISHLNIGDTLSFQQADGTFEVRTITVKPFYNGAGFRTEVSEVYFRINGQNILYKKSNPIISSGTKLSIDLIGNPDSYPDVVKTRLVSGVGINGVYPLLVSDEGVDLIPDGSQKEFKFDDKVVSLLSRVSSYDSGDNWDDRGMSLFNNINNSYDTTISTTNIEIFSYTSNNAPYQITDPKPVLEVTPKAIASNSHSIYKGGDIASQISGKITVGNGANGYESRLLENVIGHKYDYFLPTSNYVLVVKINEVVLYNGGAIAGIKGNVYKRLLGATSGSADISVYDFTNAGWEDLGALSSPTNNTISLDNSVSSSAKWFEVLEEDENGNAYAGVYGEEMVYDTTFGDGDDFAQLTNGTDIDLNGNTVKTFHGSNPLNIKMK
jgi:hypothetical protein